MRTSEHWLRVDEAFLGAVKKALEIATIKAALDGKTGDKASYEGALAELRAVQISALPDRPSTDGKGLVRCWLTLEELTDMELALEAQLKSLDNRAAFAAQWAAAKRRVTALLDRLKTTIALNKERAGVRA